MARNVPTLPTNYSTPNFITVDTAAGFNQGDMVYASGGDFGRLPNSAVTSASFNVNNTVPYISGNGSGYGNVTQLLNATPYTGAFGGSYSNSNTAKLSNGNVVRVGYNTSMQPYFTITDATNVQVVAPTVISTTNTGSTGYFVISVAALSGGGFVACWPSGGTAYFAVYTNTGTVTTATTNSAQVASNNNPPTVAAQPNGGFIIASTNSTAFIYLMLYNSTGTTVVKSSAAWSASAGGWDAQQPPSVAVRSDSSFVVVLGYQSNNQVNYMVFTANGVTQSVSTNFATSSAGNNTYVVSASTLSDGTTVAIAYTQTSSTSYPCVRLLNGSNVLASEISYQTPFFASTLSSNGILGISTFIKGLAAGGFLLGFQNRLGLLFYVFCDASGAITSGYQTGTTGFFRIASQTYQSGNFTGQAITVVEYNNTVNILWCDPFNLGLNYSNTCFVAIDPVTFDPVPSTLTTTTALGTTSLPVSGVVASTQTPQQANFYAANTSFTTNIRANGSALFSSIQVTNVQVDSCISAALNNGNFVCAYRVFSTTQVLAKIYNTAGVLQTTLTIGTSYSGGANVRYYGSVKVTPLTNGNFVVTFINDNTTLKHVVYSNTYSIVNTFTSPFYTSSSMGGTLNSQRNFDVAPLTSNRFVVVSTDASSNYVYYVFDSTGTTLSQGNLIASTNTYNHCVAGLPSGGFAYSCYYAGNGMYTGSYYNTSGNTFTSFSSSTYAFGFSNYTGGMNIAVGQGNSYYIPSYPSSSQVSVYGHAGTHGTNYSIPVSNLVGYQTTSGWATQLATTAYGELCALVQYNPNSLCLYVTSSAYYGGNTTNFHSSFNIPYTNGTNYPFSLINLAGRNMLISYIDNGLFPNIYAVNAEQYMTSLSTTAGVTQSNPTSISTNMAGIAANSAPANGNGVIQTNGSCQVNSNYSASTPATSFSFGGTFGVTGQMVGRNVTLYNNNKTTT